ATDAGASRYPGHTVGQARSTSVKPTFCVGPALARVYSFFMDSGARREHELLVGNAKMGVFFPLVVEYRRPFVLRKVRTYLRKSHFPTESFIVHIGDSSALAGFHAIPMKGLYQKEMITTCIQQN